MGTEKEKIVPARVLPESYREIWSLDLSKNQRAALVLNILALPLFFACGWLFVKLAVAIRPEITNRIFYSAIAIHPLKLFPLLFTVIAGMMILHEAIHGLFFWVFTRSRPIFGIKLLFAYAGAPDWYIPRDQYTVIGLAPFVLMSVVGFLLIPFVSLLASRLTLFGIVMNASGAIGDLYVVAKVLRQPRDVMIQDTGFGFAIFGKPGITFPQ